MNARLGLLSAAALVLAACQSVSDPYAADSGPVQLSCPGSLPVPGAPPLKDSLSPLAPGVELEIRKLSPQAPVRLTLPEGKAGDEFNYAWKEASAGPGRLPGTWLCRVSWQYDGNLWQLMHLDAQWVGGAAR
ncbi:MAG TPA: hypothetical protein VHP13_09420 [Gammaproteobacteria bacterium]|jgi:hypothetical protein|nr:hypothetical protein [Gammaproteobacteria bacterium]